jgi:hypothetical protein
MGSCRETGHIIDILENFTHIWRQNTDDIKTKSLCKTLLYSVLSFNEIHSRISYNFHLV